MFKRLGLTAGLFLVTLGFASAAPAPDDRYDRGRYDSRYDRRDDRRDDRARREYIKRMEKERRRAEKEWRKHQRVYRSSYGYYDRFGWHPTDRRW
jgi:hypothetical protein